MTLLQGPKDTVLPRLTYIHKSFSENEIELQPRNTPKKIALYLEMPTLFLLWIFLKISYIVGSDILRIISLPYEKVYMTMPTTFFYLF